MSVLAKQTIVRTQKIQRQPSLCTITPPKRGPIVGPRRGPSKYHPNIPARSPGPHISEIVPPPLAILTLPKKPANVRTKIKVSILGVRALGIWSRLKAVKHDKYIGRRPNVSERGASISGPIPSMITKPVVPYRCVSIGIFLYRSVCVYLQLITC